MDLIVFLIYEVMGWKANNYLKYHLLNVRAEIYYDTGNHYIRKFILAALFGWATIPLAILHWLFKKIF